MDGPYCVLRLMIIEVIFIKISGVANLLALQLTSTKRSSSKKCLLGLGGGGMKEGAGTTLGVGSGHLARRSFWVLEAPLSITTTKKITIIHNTLIFLGSFLVHAIMSFKFPA